MHRTPVPVTPRRAAHGQGRQRGAPLPAAATCNWLASALLPPRDALSLLRCKGRCSCRFAWGGLAPGIRRERQSTSCSNWSRVGPGMGPRGMAFIRSRALAIQCATSGRSRIACTGVIVPMYSSAARHVRRRDSSNEAGAAGRHSSFRRRLVMFAAEDRTPRRRRCRGVRPQAGPFSGAGCGGPPGPPVRLAHQIPEDHRRDRILFPSTPREL